MQLRKQQLRETGITGRRPILTLVALAAVIAIPVAVAAPPTGDPQAIVFAASVVQAYRHVASVQLVRRGYLSYRWDARTGFRWHWGSRPPVGYRPARESLTYLLHQGRVTAVADRLTGTGLPVEQLVDEASGFWAWTGRCYARTPRRSSPNQWAFGQNFETFDGYRLLPLRRSGQVVILTTTRQVKHWTLTDIQRVSATTRLELSERWSWTGPYGYTATQTYGSQPTTGQGAVVTTGPGAGLLPPVEPRCS